MIPREYLYPPLSLPPGLTLDQIVRTARWIEGQMGEWNGLSFPFGDVR